MMRMLVAAQRGFDVLMAEDRIGATSELARIYEDNPTTPNNMGATTTSAKMVHSITTDQDLTGQAVLTPGT
jgi:hypothetical protein